MMRKFLLLFLLPLQVLATEALVKFSNFLTVLGEPYIEADILIPAATLTIVKEKDLFKVGVVIDITITSSEGNRIGLLPYILDYPSADSLNLKRISLIDRNRIKAAIGVYVVDCKIIDLYDSTDIFTYSFLHELQFPEGQATVSSIQLIEKVEKAAEDTKFLKDGKQYLPYLAGYYPEDVNMMGVYFEIYFPNPQPALLTFGIRPYLKSFLPEYTKSMKIKQDTLIPIYSVFDITNLPTGNFEIYIEIKNTGNKTIATRKQFFQRKNVEFAVNKYSDVIKDSLFTYKLSEEEVLLYVSATKVFIGVNEARAIDYMLKERDLSRLRLYLYQFWENKAPFNPEKAFREHKAQIDLVEEKYANNKQHGFETDRGRVFIKYGPPNQILGSSTDPSVLPYEIWHYYGTIDGQSNARFVFYNANYAGNDYELLHSTVFGELQNPDWRKVLIGPYTGDQIKPTDYGQNPFQEHFGHKLEEYYNQ